MIMFRKLVLFVLLCIVVVDSKASNKRLNGARLAELKRKIANPQLSDDIKGKTLRELGVIKSEASLRKGRRREEEGGGGRKFFSVRFSMGWSVALQRCETF